MKNSNNLFKKFVLFMGIFNFPIGIWMITESLLNKTGESLITNVVSGEFIIFTGAALVWSTTKLSSRAPIIVWNGLVRFFSVLFVIYASTNGEVPEPMFYISGMDLLLAITFIFGTAKVTGVPLSKLIVGKTNDV